MAYDAAEELLIIWDVADIIERSEGGEYEAFADAKQVATDTITTAIALLQVMQNDLKGLRASDL